MGKASRRRKKNRKKQKDSNVSMINKPKKKDSPQKSSKNGYLTQIRRDTVTEWPDIWAEVYIAADNAVEERRIATMMMIGGKCRKAETPESADIVVFGGGADVQPHLYGEKAHITCVCDAERDKRDRELFTKCYEEGIPMFGICRGAQFGHVMMGGKLFQHVDNHTGDHGMWLKEENKIIPRISSVHHQMVIPHSGMTVLGLTPGRSMTRYMNSERRVRGKNDDIEAFFYRNACFFGVQGHPEYEGYVQFREWTMDTIRELLSESPDLVLKDGVRRVKQEILDRRPKLSKLKENV